MVKLFIELLEFLRSCVPLLFSTAFFALFSILLSKSIKKRAAIYYTVFAIPFAMVAVPFIFRLFGVEIFSFNRVPVLGTILRDYIHMGTLGHPLLIVIMYMGALNPKNQYVKRLMSIRKELSSISGFPILTHTLIRVTNNFPNGLKFFFNNEEYMATSKVVNELGAGFSNFSYVLGIVMVALFIPLWVTSFSSIHRRMGNAKWKKLQKWSYVLYVTLFIHAMGIQVGGMLNPRGGHAPRPATETVAQALPQATETSEGTKPDVTTENSGERDNRNAATSARPENSNRGSQANTQTASGHQSVKGLADIKVNPKTRQYIHLFSLLLIYGSYLYLRVRKAKKDAKRHVN